MQKITPFLWFNDQAEEAANFYASLFKNAKVKNIARYGKEGADVSGRAQGSVMTVNFELEGQEFIALNGGSMFSFTPAISFIINCETQQEVDHFWDKLSEGGEESRCGWLKDRYGVSWQVVPTALGAMLDGKDPERSKRVMTAMLQMAKIDINTLRRAYEQK